MKTKTKNRLMIGVAIVGFLLIDYTILKPKFVSDPNTNIDLPEYNEIELSQYNGTKQGLPILLALDGLIYDVSAGGEDFYNPGQSYHYLVGVDSSRYLHIFGDNLIKKKYPVVGRFVR